MKTVELTDLVIQLMKIDYEHQVVRVVYKLVDSSGKEWNSGLARFWVTMPDVPSDNDFQLPAGYISTLVQLRDDADTALTNKFLV